MKDLVFTGENDQALTDSLLIAEKFGKNHQHVLRDIDSLKKDVSNFGQMFIEASYADTYGRPQRMYAINRDGFTLLAMGFTGAQAMKFKVEYINAFNRMEAKIKTGFQIPQTFAEALKLAAKQAQAIEERNKQIEADKPKVLFADAVSTSQKSCLIGELAKILKQNGIEIGERRLFQWMREHEYLCSHGERYNLPTQKSMELQLFEIKKTTITKPDGTVLVSTTPKVTGKGQIYFVNKFLKC
jgi:anti-repressor protein